MMISSFISLSFGTENKIKIAVSLRFNDGYNTTVERIYRGIETAKEVFEAKNHNTSIFIKKYAHDTDLQSVLKVAQEIVKDKNIAVIGGELSRESLIFSDIFNQSNIVFITPTSSNPSVTLNKPFAFRACFSDDIVANLLANFTYKDLKPKNIGVIHNVSSPYTDFLSKEFISKFSSLTTTNPLIKIFEYKTLADTPSYENEIKDMIAHDVTHVILLTHDDDLLRFVTQASKYNFFPVFVGSDGWGPSKPIFDRLVNNSKYGDKFIAYHNVYWKEDSKSGLSTDFRKFFVKKYKNDPDAWNAIGFDSAYVLFTSIKNIKGEITSKSIQKSLKNISNLNLVTNNNFSFNSNNSPLSGMNIYQISKSGIKYEATLK